MKKIELLSPAGDFECLKAAVQNGADAVYLGLADFNARSSAKNFSLDELEKAIDYSHLRNVKVFLTLNTLLKNDEIDSALSLVSCAYQYGIDGIIVQDFGVAKLILENFPDLPIHASTQMTCNNLYGVNFLEKNGFKRIVLSRELSLDEINYIKSNCSCEVEVFSHGALCICYSGQCLYSSMIGGRSGNRGKCAQGCRLPYSLLENDNVIDKGYLLSPKDLCSLELLPELVKTGIDSLKIEGRMKSPEYVAIVTKIYRKYLDKLLNNEDYVIDQNDINMLLQVFNRGGFSSGHLSNNPNTDLIYKNKPNNMGIYIGNVSNYNQNKGHITLTLNENLSIGDTISFEHEDCRYTVSELMIKNTNLKNAKMHDRITIGRMKGNIKVGDKIYKLASKELSNLAISSFSTENIKSPIFASLNVHMNQPMSLEIKDMNGNTVTAFSNEKPELAQKLPITKDKLSTQLDKLNDTPFYFDNIQINIDDNIFIPHISSINELRRNAINQYSQLLINKFKRNRVKINSINFNNDIVQLSKSHKISLLLNVLDLSKDYSNLSDVDRLYIPLKYFYLKEYSNLLRFLSLSYNIYIYMPNIIKLNFINLAIHTIENSLLKYKISGFVISNIGQFDMLEKYKKDYEFISNFNLNIFNNCSALSYDTNVITISPELNKDEINRIASNSNKQSEFIVYGNTPLMTSNYCLLGNTNKCYPKCAKKCLGNNKYYLKDRMNFKFRIIPNNIQTITTLYNSKTTFIDISEIPNIDIHRIDIIDENIDEINTIIDTIKNGIRLEGKEYTNGNLNRSV